MIIGDLTVLISVAVFMVMSIMTAVMLIKTPAGTFLWAMIKRRKILIHPTEDRYLTFKVVKSGPMAYEKGRGYYSVYPEDVYVESHSKIPMAIVYGNTGITLNPQMIMVAEKLKEFGFKNFAHIINWAKKMTEAGKDLGNIVIFGESVNPSKAIDYFSMNMRSDLTEAEIQRRTAAMQAMQKKNNKDFMLYAIVLVVILIGGAIAWQIVSQNMATSAASHAAAATPNPIVSAVTGGAGIGVK